MVTCREIVTASLRKIGIIGSGRRVPSADEAQDGLTNLRGMYERWATGGAFGKFREVIATADYTAHENERVRISAGVVVTLPTTIPASDRYNLTGDDRAPYDLACVIVTQSGTEPQLNVYDANAGAWVRLDGLTLDSAAPFAGRGRDGLACALAVFSAEEYGAAVGQVTMTHAAAFRFALLTRFAAERRVVDYEFF